MLGRELDTHALQRAGRTSLSDKPVAAFKNYGKKGTIAPFDLLSAPRRDQRRFGWLAGIRTNRTAEVIFGIKPADSGTALIKANRKPWRLPHQASVLGIGFCPEDRKTDDGIAAASVRENSDLLSGPARLATTDFPQRAARDRRTICLSLAFAHLQLNNRLNFSPAAISKKCCFHVGY